MISATRVSTNCPVWSGVRVGGVRDGGLGAGGWPTGGTAGSGVTAGASGGGGFSVMASMTVWA